MEGEWQSVCMPFNGGGSLMEILSERNVSCC
jgi:hypothetical protein